MSSTALSGAAIAIATAASIEAQEANCRQLMRGFHNDTATQNQQVQYADCVRLTMPSSENDHHIIQGAVAVLLVATLIGAVIGWRSDPMDRMFGVLGGAGTGMLIAITAELALAAVLFVLGVI